MLEKLYEQAGTLLLNQGFSGLVIFALVLAVIKLAKLYNSVQELRIKEALESQQAMLSMQTSLDRLSDVLRASKTGTL